MDFRIADTFTDALARLPSQDQKAVKVSVMDLQLDPTAPGLQMHRIDKSRDANFWSARVNRDIRLILHKTGSSLLVAWVGHHDDAYAWAERRRIETHPRTGAVQIVEVRERVEEAQPDLARIWSPAESPVFAVAEAPVPSFLFDALTSDQLMSIGVPEDWITPVLRTSEAGFFDLADHLPSEAAEALLQFATTGRLKTPELSFEPATTPDPYQHPDARRRFATIETVDDLRAALDAPWDKWSVFLHPSQRTVVERAYAGPARVAGSAGTGKTVVALHRAGWRVQIRWTQHWTKRRRKPVSRASQSASWRWNGRRSLMPAGWHLLTPTEPCRALVGRPGWGHDSAKHSGLCSPLPH
jgi:mRNA-degrading endonuclease RelE of RelBE toxin-antitoxin system